MVPPKTDFGGMTLNECILRASKIEDMMTDCNAFNAATATQGNIYTFFFVIQFLQSRNFKY